MAVALVQLGDIECEPLSSTQKFRHELMNDEKNSHLNTLGEQCLEFNHRARLEIDRPARLEMQIAKAEICP